MRWESALRRCLSKRDTGNAFVAWLGDSPVRAEKALRAAAEADSRWAAGTQLSKIDGMAVAVKDNFCLQDEEWRTTAGSKVLENFHAPYTATAVERLLKAGAIIVGKTNLDEFAMGSYGTNSYFGPSTVESKLNGRRIVAGGSSSGSASAVSQGLATVALGSDTGGSVRLPGAFCGIVGLKPTYGRVSRHGLISYASSLDTPGILATELQDAVDVLDVISGIDDLDSTSLGDPWDPIGNALEQSPQTIRIGIPVEFNVSELEKDVLANWERCAQILERTCNASIVPVSVPSIEDVLPAYYVIATAEASSNLARYDGVEYGYRTQLQDGDLHAEYIASRTESFGEEVKRRLLMGNFVLSSEAYDDYYVRACQIRNTLRREFAKVFEEVDILLSPVSPVAPPTLEEVSLQSPVDAYLADIMTVPASMAGLPALSLPTDRLAESVQLISKHGDERTLCIVARALEKSFCQT